MVASYLLLITILLGAILRFYGLKWGLPHTFHADEHLFVIRQALRLEYNILCNHSLNPEFSSYGSLTLYIFLAVKWIYFKILQLFSENINLPKIQSCNEFTDYLKTFYSYEKVSGKIYMPTLFIIGRAISAFFGSISIYLIFSLAKKLFNQSVGILSAIFFALTVGLIQSSHFFTVDNILIFFIILTLSFGVDILKKGDSKYYIFAGLSLGLALSVKLISIFLFIPVLIAHILNKNRIYPESKTKKVISKNLTFLILTSIILYLLLNPYSILDFKNYWGSSDSVTALGNLFSFYHKEAFSWTDWRFSYNGTVPYWYYIKNLLFFGMGIFLEAISLIGIFYSIIKKEESDKFLLSFTIPFFLIVGSWKVKTIRYILPLIPFLIIAGARFLIDLYSEKENIFNNFASKLLIVIVIISAFIYSLAYVNIYSVTDTRIQASDWIYKNVKQGSVILLDNQYHYTVPLGSNRGLIGVENSKKPIFTEKILWEMTENKNQEYIKEHLQEKLTNADYIIVSEWYYHSFCNSYAPELATVQYNFYNKLFSGKLGYKLAKYFNSSPNLFGKVFSDDNSELLFKVFDHPRIFIFKKSYSLPELKL